MNHLREGIHWSSVGQRDPLVEYRRRSQAMFEEMQSQLRREVLRNLFHAVPVAQSPNEQTMTETELTRAAKSSVDNADQIIEAEVMSEASSWLKRLKNRPLLIAQKRKNRLEKQKERTRKRAGVSL